MASVDHQPLAASPHISRDLAASAGRPVSASPFAMATSMEDIASWSPVPRVVVASPSPAPPTPSERMASPEGLAEALFSASQYAASPARARPSSRKGGGDKGWAAESGSSIWLMHSLLAHANGGTAFAPAASPKRSVAPRPSASPGARPSPPPESAASIYASSLKMQERAAALIVSPPTPSEGTLDVLALSPLYPYQARPDPRPGTPAARRPPARLTAARRPQLQHLSPLAALPGLASPADAPWATPGVLRDWVTPGRSPALPLTPSELLLGGGAPALREGPAPPSSHAPSALQV